MALVLYFIAFFPIGIAMLATAQADTDPPPTDPKDLELIQTILKHNQAAIDKIKSFRLEEEWETVSSPKTQQTPEDPPPGEQKNSCRITYVARDKWYRGDKKYVTDVADKGYRKEARRQAVLNGSCFVIVNRSGGRDSIRRVEHATIDDMRDDEHRRAESERPRSALNFASASHYDFSIRLENPTTTWSVERINSEEGSCYIISSRDPKAGTASYSFDPDKDFLLVAIDAAHADGKPYYDLRVTLSKMNGIWFPQMVEENRVEEPDDSSKFSLRVLRAELNPEIPDSEFDFERLDIDRSAAVMTVIRESSTKPEHLIFRHGKWVPKELVSPQK